MTDPSPVADPLLPVERRELERKLAATAARLKKGADAREKRMQTDSAFAGRVESIAVMPKEVKVLYAELCGEDLPRELCNLVHREVAEGTYSAVALYRCCQHYAATEARYHMDRMKRDRMIERIEKAIKLREGLKWNT